MFRPRTSPVSHEEFRDADADTSIEVPEAQAVRGDVLRLIPLTGAPRAQDLGWTRLSWSQEDELPSFPGDIAGRWDAYFNNQFLSSPQLFEFEPVSKFLDIDTEGGEYQFMRQRAAAAAGQRHWSDQVDNASGWVVQFRVQSVTDQTGYGVLNGHYVSFDDGVHRERCFIHHTGIFFEENPALDIRCDMTRVREVRIGAKQDDLYVLLDNGLGAVALDGFTGNSIEKELGFGTTGAIAHYRTIWDYVNQYHGGAWIDDRDHVLPVYSTSGSTATTSSYHPKRRVSRFDAGYIHALGDVSNGTTQVTAQYRSSAVSSWTTHGTITITEIGVNRIDLSGIPVAGDGSDEVRFLVFQQSTTGAGEPPRVDMITVVTTFETPGVIVTPRYGHKRGGSSHLLELLTGADQVMRQQSTLTGLSFLARFDGSYNDEIGLGAGTPSGAAFTGGRYGQAVELGTLPSAASPWTTFGQSFAETVPYGRLDAGSHPIFTSLTGTLILTTGVIGTVEGNAAIQRAAQRAEATARGDGFEVRSLTGPGAFGFLLQIVRGSVKVKHGSEEHVFTVYDYWTPKTVVVKSDSSADLEFTSGEDGSEWLVGHPQAFSRTTGQVSFSPITHEQGDGFAADLFVTVRALSDGPLFTRLSGSNGFEIGLAPGGYPYVRAGDGVRIDHLTGNYPIRVGEEHNIALNYRRFGDHTGLQVLVDGDVCGEKITTLDQITAGAAGVTVGGYHPVKVEQARIHSDQIDAHQFSILNGFSNPSFQSAYSVPRGTNNILILRMGYRAGAHADDSGRAHHAYSRLDGRSGLARSRAFESRSAYLFWHGAVLGVLHTSDFTQSLPQAVFARGLFYRTTRVQELYSKWDVAETVGWKVEILEDGTVKVTAKDGVSTYELTSDVVLADRRRRAIYAAVKSTGLEIRIDGITKTSSASVGSLAAATGDARIGHHLAAYLGEFVVRNAELTADDYDDWSDPTVAKWSPSDDQIWIDGEAIDNERIIHLSPDRKYFTAPPGGPGNVPVHAVIDGVILGAERPFKYVHGYIRELPSDRVDKFVQKTHSVFRIVNEVPPGGVNIAFLQGGDISVERNVSHVDLSHSRSQNLSTYFGGEFALKDMLTGDRFSLYTGQLDTDDMRVSNRSVMRREVTAPTPLFYRYLIGRGRRYVYQPNATSAADIAVIRNGITLLDGFGQLIPFGKFPWEIEVATTDVSGNSLPANVFAVTLFSNLPFLDDVSVQVRYNAVDGLHDWALQQNFLEIVNPEAALARVAGNPGHDEYVVSLTPTGTYDLKVGRTGL